MRHIIGAALVVGLVLSGQRPADALIFGRCGDGKIKPLVEQCDGANLDGASCQSRGFNSGTLACTATCKLDTSGCNTIQEDLGMCQSDLGTAQGGLTTCNSNLTTCQSALTAEQGSLVTCTTNLTTCTSDLTTCQSDLAACEAEPVFAFPASGQTTPFTADKNDGIVGPVSVPDDGTLQAGAPLSYTDNGDGTITDNNTGLMWEKKSDDGGLHDKDNLYRWNGNGSQETIWDWLEDLNAANFGGFNDWRIPNVKELQSIVDYGRFNPGIDPVFHTACVAACTVLTCSCTVSSFYWSATTYAGSPTSAWYVHFFVGHVDTIAKSISLFVRAVRGGS